MDYFENVFYDDEKQYSFYYDGKWEVMMLCSNFNLFSFFSSIFYLLTSSQLRKLTELNISVLPLWRLKLLPSTIMGQHTAS